MMKKTVVLLIAILAISAPAFGAEWLVNGTFEADTPMTGSITDAVCTPFQNWLPTGWSAFNACSNTAADGTGLSVRGRTAYGVITDATYAGSDATMQPVNATKDYYLSARGGNTSGGYCGIYQEVNLLPGTYTLTGYVSTKNFNMTVGANDWYAWEIGVIRGAWGNAGVPLYGGSGQRIPEYGSATEFGIWGNKNVDTGGVAVALTSLPYLAGGPGSNQIVVTTAGIYTIYVEAGTNYNASATNKARFKIRVDDLSLSGTPTPVPEPVSLLALGTGLIGLVGTIRRKR